MLRTARKKSNSGIYHVIVRGINRQDIFHEEEDYRSKRTVPMIPIPAKAILQPIND
ncbi:hypothetical protein SOV_01020 [Sporomusa ovata DSM 2662]|uniref:hypothetical protein n=1 Tax=Sporomusa ovata TaxID=2378 RepID=UPI0003883C18|nr:hypothetical protein SOV_2c06940 [Sporomusa ovata DSM 2662]